MTSAGTHSEAPVFVTKKGVSINWRTILGIVGAVSAVGIGGGAGLSFLTEPKAAPVDHVEKLRVENQAMHDEDRAAITTQGKTLVIVAKTTEKLLDGQNRQIAREEARRFTADIKDRERREREFDRLYDLTLWRLQGNKEPCRSLDCQE